MIAVDGNIVWDHAVRAAEVVTPILIVMWNNRRKAIKDSNLWRDKVEQKIEGLKVVSKFFPHHRHDEKTGPLHAEGITPYKNGD